DLRESMAAVRPTDSFAEAAWSRLVAARPIRTNRSARALVLSGSFAVALVAGLTSVYYGKSTPKTAAAIERVRIARTVSPKPQRLTAAPKGEVSPANRVKVERSQPSAAKAARRKPTRRHRTTIHANRQMVAERIPAVEAST